MVHAYGIDSFHFVSSNGQAIKADGTGETIAIVDAYHDPNLFNDLHNFDRNYGLPDPQVDQYHYGNQSDDGWAGEETLDVEWAHAIAPGARIVVVESATTSDLFTAVNFARNLSGVVAVSMSWGQTEFSGESSYDSLFTTPAGHAPITFIASTGDHGAWPGQEYPAVSPNVLAVGGTTLNVDSRGDYLGETGWSGGSAGSDGGGYSKYEPKPFYQAGAQPYGVRSVPDVSMDADPNTGVWIYVTTPSNGAGSWQQFGGTSLAAPMWAGLIAIVDQGRAVAGKPSLDGPSQTLPAIYSSRMSGDFHDITQGFNGYYAGPGYDVDTGLGTPIAFNVVKDLMQVVSYSPQTNAAPAKVGSTPSADVPPGRFDLAVASLSDAKGAGSKVSGPEVALPPSLLPTAPGLDANHRRHHDLALAAAFDALFGDPTV